MYKAVIFDLDGTILDTLDDLADSVNFALKKHGLPVRENAEIRSFLGNGMVNLVKLSAGDKAENIEGILADFKEYYAKHSADKTKPYDGVLETISALKEQGVKTAVLSNKGDFAVQPLVKRYFGGLIERAQGENEAAGVLRKPNPDGVYKIMKELGVTEKETVFVGDSEVDILTAKNAGVDCVAVTWGFRDEKDLIENGAEKRISKPSELLDFFK
jgi:phosphoglycolate phosphatase